MKDSILNSTLIAVTLAAILLAAFDGSNTIPQPVTAQASRAVTAEKTVVAAKRLPMDLTLAALAAR